MSTSEDINRLEAELETHKRDFREDVARVDDKIQATKAEFSPTNLIQHYAVVLTGIALLLGFGVGWLLDRPGETVQQAGKAVGKAGKPVALNLLASAGKQAAGRAIRGN